MKRRPRPACRVCERPLARGHFLCVEHWYKLDKGHRDAVTSAMAKARRAPDSGDALRGLWAAQDDAVESLEVSS